MLRDSQTIIDLLVRGLAGGTKANTGFRSHIGAPANDNTGRSAGLQIRAARQNCGERRKRASDDAQTGENLGNGSVHEARLSEFKVENQTEELRDIVLGNYRIARGHWEFKLNQKRVPGTEVPRTPADSSDAARRLYGAAVKR